MSSTPEAGLIILGLKMWGITIRSAQIEPVFVHERQIDTIHSHPLIMRNWWSNSEALEGGSKFLTRHGCILRFKNLWQSQVFFLQRYPFLLDPKNQPPFRESKAQQPLILVALGRRQLLLRARHRCRGHAIGQEETEPMRWSRSGVTLWLTVGS